MRESELKTYEKYEALGYDVIKNGIPDLILLKGGQIEFVEVKTDLNPQLTEYQKSTIKLLEKHGIPVRVEVVECNPQGRNKRSLYSFPLNVPYHPRARPPFPLWLFEPEIPTRAQEV